MARRLLFGAGIQPPSDPPGSTAMKIPKLANRLGLSTLATASLLATSVACTSGHAPELMGLSDQVAQVGTELTIDLDGTDADGDRLTYDYKAADLTDLSGNAQITVSPRGAGVFRWTPLAADLGAHAFDFTVSDGSHVTPVTININVKRAIGSKTTPLGDTVICALPERPVRSAAL